MFPPLCIQGGHFTPLLDPAPQLFPWIVGMVAKIKCCFRLSKQLLTTENHIHGSNSLLLVVEVAFKAIPRLLSLYSSAAYFMIYFYSLFVFCMDMCVQLGDIYMCVTSSVIRVYRVSCTVVLDAQPHNINGTIVVLECEERC